MAPEGGDVEPGFGGGRETHVLLPPLEVVVKTMAGGIATRIERGPRRPGKILGRALQPADGPLSPQRG